jgi:O-antigen/teichoic acid export membrane protein
LIKPLTSIFGFSLQLKPLFYFLAWLLLLDSLALFSLHLLKTKQLAKQAVLYSLITAVVNIVLNLVLLLVFKLGIIGILIAQGGANIVLLLLCLKWVNRGYTFSIDFALLKRLLVFSFPLMLAGVCGILMDVADRFIIDLYVDRSAVGIYSVAYKIGLVMSLFVVSFRTAYLPYFLDLRGKVQSGAESAQSFFGKLRRSFLLLILVMLLILGVVMLLVPYLFKLKLFGFTLFGEAYLPAVSIVPYILLAYLFNGLAAFFSIGPYISGKSRHFLISDAIGLGGNIILNLLLIPTYGMKGAAIATMLGFFMATLYLFIIFIKEINVIKA